MESKRCRKVPIILYDGTLVKKESESDRRKADQQNRDIKLIPIKINFINSSGKTFEKENESKSTITPRGEAKHCFEVKSDMMSSQALEKEGKNGPIISCSPPHDRDQHHEDQQHGEEHHGDQQHGDNHIRDENITIKHIYKNETLRKMDVRDLRDETESFCISEGEVEAEEDQNLKIKPTPSCSVDWRLTQKNLNQIYEDLEVSWTETNI